MLTLMKYGDYQIITVILSTTTFVVTLSASVSESAEYAAAGTVICAAMVWITSFSRCRRNFCPL